MTQVGDRIRPAQPTGWNIPPLTSFARTLDPPIWVDLELEVEAVLGDGVVGRVVMLDGSVCRMLLAHGCYERVSDGRFRQGN